MVTEPRLALIAELEAAIHACLKTHVREDEPVAILDFPDIRNCGDSAIWLGEMAYLANRHGKRPAYVSRMDDFSTDQLRRAAPGGPIFIHDRCVAFRRHRGRIERRGVVFIGHRQAGIGAEMQAHRAVAFDSIAVFDRIGEKLLDDEPDP